MEQGACERILHMETPPPKAIRDIVTEFREQFRRERSRLWWSVLDPMHRYGFFLRVYARPNGTLCAWLTHHANTAHELYSEQYMPDRQIRRRRRRYIQEPSVRSLLSAGWIEAARVESNADSYAECARLGLPLDNLQDDAVPRTTFYRLTDEVDELITAHIAQTKEEREGEK